MLRRRCFVRAFSTDAPERTMPNLGFFGIFMVSSVTMWAVPVQGARFRGVGDLMSVACSTRYSSSDSVFRWMILLSSKTWLPSAWISALKSMKCHYEIRTLESLQHWNTTGVMPNVDYKVIAIGISSGGLRDALSYYVSMKSFVR